MGSDSDSDSERVPINFGSSGSSDSDSNSSGDSKGGPAIAACLCCCLCLLGILFLAIPIYAAGQVTAKHLNWAADIYVNCSDYPDAYCTDGDFWTPMNGTRYLAWGGCAQGWKSDEELDVCGGECFDGSLPISM